MLCDLGIKENAVHIIMQCTYHERTRIKMFEAIDHLEMEIRTNFHNSNGNEFLNLMGKNMDGIIQMTCLRYGIYLAHILV